MTKINDMTVRQRHQRDRLLLAHEHLPLWLASHMLQHWKRAYREAVSRLGIQDAASAARVAMCWAAAKFDTSRDLKFTTYATRCMIGQVLVASKLDRMIHIPLYLFWNRNDQPSASTLALRKHAESLPLNLLSLSWKHGENEHGYDYDLPVWDPDDVDERDELETHSRQLETAISRLKPRLQQVVRLNFFDGQNYRQIASVMHCSRERVRQLRDEALAEMREILA